MRLLSDLPLFLLSLLVAVGEEWLLRVVGGAAAAAVVVAVAVAGGVAFVVVVAHDSSGVAMMVVVGISEGVNVDAAASVLLPLDLTV